MRLYRWQGHAPNFGDELNTLLWPRLLPGFFDDDASEIFLGIGSVLDSRHPASVRKVVAGAGYGGYEALPVLDGRWTIHWVRGPETARRLGLPIGFGLGDPASLVDSGMAADMLGAGSSAAGAVGFGGERRAVGFMPHFETACRGAWARAAALAGLVLIDPRDDPRTVIAAIARCRLLVSEAMHGVIVADALRVPWVAAAPLARVHAPKWQDWAAALDTTVDFVKLTPSSFGEQLRLTGAAGRPLIRALLDRGERHVQALAAERFAGRAAAALDRAARAMPRLSDDHGLARSRERMRAALDGVRRQPRPADNRYFAIGAVGW